MNRKSQYLATPAILFVTLLAIFLISRVHQVADSNYSMLLSQSLLQHRSFTLDAYNLPRLPPKPQVGYMSNGEIYQLEIVDGHLYYFFPPGSSILSLPYVAIMNLIGISAANSDGTYNARGEGLIEVTLAALLMSGLGVMIFITARLLLSWGWSLLLAISALLGTQIWSTASRALWSDTWGIFILGIVLFLVTRTAVKKVDPPPIVLATLLSWLYFVRPTFSTVVIATTFYVLIYHRRVILRFTITGVLWAGLFIGYSEYQFHQLLPNYYEVRRLSFSSFWMALAGNLISPSRGLLIFVPVSMVVVYLLIRYRQQVKLGRLVILSAAVIVMHVIVVSGFVPWWGGHSFGPRYATALVPWFSLLGILALEARLSAPATGLRSSRLRVVESVLAIALLLVSVAINGVGANSHRAWQWNVRPVNVDEKPDRIWDWRHPQFLAAFLPPPTNPGK